MKLPGFVNRLISWALDLKPVRAYVLFMENNGLMLADSVTYRALFSVFAGAMLGFSIAGLWLADNDQAMQALIDAVDLVIPGLIGEDGAIHPDDLIQPLAFNIASAVALVGLVGAAIGAVGALGVAFRRVSDQAPDRTFFIWLMARNLVIAVGVGVALVASAVITVAGTAALEAFFDWMGISEHSMLLDAGVRGLSILLALVIDTVAIAVMFRILSGLRPSARALWPGAVLGGIALTGLQVLSALFVGGAAANPLLAPFASLIALLIWLNLSSQVFVLAGAYIVIGVDDARNQRVRGRLRDRGRPERPSPTVRRLQHAERQLRTATAEAERVRAEVEAEQAKAEAEQAKAAAERG